MYKNLDPIGLGIAASQSEIIEGAMSNGFKGLSLDLVEFAATAERNGLPKARRFLDSSRLKIGPHRLAVQWDAEDDTYREDLARLTPLLGLAEQLGCRQVTALIEPASDTRPYHENFELQRRRLGEVAELAGRHQMNLGLEFLAPTKLAAERTYQFIQKVDALLMFFKSVAGPNVGLAIDTWHWHLGGGTLDDIRALGPSKIVAVSLADVEPGATADTANLDQRKLTGEGEGIDTAALFALLVERKYEGPVTPLPSRTQFAGQSRDKLLKQLGASIDTLWKNALPTPTVDPRARMATAGGKK
jgi:sugar phosphate isomerase/epimerase